MKCPVCKEKISINVQTLYLHRCNKCERKFEDRNKKYFLICNVVCIIVGLLICGRLNEAVSDMINNDGIALLILFVIYIIVVHVLQIITLIVAHKFIK